MVKSESAYELEIREQCKDMLKEKGGSPEEKRARLIKVNNVLSLFGDEIPFVSCREDFEEFNLLQTTTTDKLMDLEIELHCYGNEAGLTIFKEAIKDFFFFEEEILFELEKEGAAFWEIFRNKYLLKYAESIFIDISLEWIPDLSMPIGTLNGQCYSSYVYQLYTLLYKDASKERKRNIQSILQKRGLTVKDLKKASRIKP